MATEFTERAIAFGCGGETLIGVIARPKQLTKRGTVIVVGGPQYRVGSHRQFILLARYLASNGVATMRFDYRGMGDSSGELRDFEHVDADIGAAIDTFSAEAPEIEDIFLWGLCDAATASLFYAHRDARVRALILLNPWVRTRESEAKAYLKHYYLQRLIDPQFWSKVVAGRFDPGRSYAGLVKLLKQSVLKGNGDIADRSTPTGGSQNEPLPQRMATAMERFTGRVMFILSGKDLTAKEFMEVARADVRWRQLMSAGRVKRIDLAEANHTFSSSVWRNQVAEVTREFIAHS